LTLADLKNVYIIKDLLSLALYYFFLQVSREIRGRLLAFYILRLFHVRTARLNINKFYMVLTLRLSVLCGLFPFTALTDWFCITEVESVYCAVNTESLCKTDTFRN
jgi:hypothetical protein